MLNSDCAKYTHAGRPIDCSRIKIEDNKHNSYIIIYEESLLVLVYSTHLDGSVGKWC